MRLLIINILLFISFGTFAQYRFIENKGQWHPNVLYRTEVGNGHIYYEKSEVTFDFYDAEKFESYIHAHYEGNKEEQLLLKKHSYKVKFVNANNNCEVSQQKPYPTKYNYFIGRKNHAKDVSAYGIIRYQELYPNIDMIWYSKNEKQLKYDLVVKPKANPKEITLLYKGTDGIQIKKGNLIITTSIGKIIEQKPFAYQVINDKKVEIECKYILDKNRNVKFEIGEYDKSIDLIIDPVLIFSTYSGSFSNNFGYTASYDREGFLYSGSTAFGTNYPTTTGAYDITFNGGIVDVAITKYDTSGTFMVYSTFIGGTVDELPHSIFVDQQNQLYLFGTTSSTDFPYTTGCYDSTFNGGTAINLTNGLGVNFLNGSDIFVCKLNNQGNTLLASTYIGGSANDGLNSTPSNDLRYNYADEVRGEIQLDNDANVYIISCTRSADFPVTSGVFQPSYGGGDMDGCVFKMDANLSTLFWSSFIGGSNEDAGYSLALDSIDNPVVVGGTNSTDLSTSPLAYRKSYQGGRSDGFITKIDKSGNNLLSSTYWGSDIYDQNYFVEIDRNQSIYILGQTEKTDSTFIKNSPAYSNDSSGQIITKFKPNLDTIEWSTVFGSGSGRPDISPSAFLVDFCNRVYVSGWGGTTNQLSQLNNNAGNTFNMDVTTNAFQNTTDGSDFYLFVMDVNASGIVYGSYFGGNISSEHVDGGTSRFDPNGIVYQSVCAGCGGNDDFPIRPSPGAVSAVNNNSCNNGVFKFDFEPSISFADFRVDPVHCITDSVQFTNLTRGNNNTYFWDFGDGNTSTQISPKHLYSSSGTYNVMLVSTNPLSCNISDTIFQQIQILSDTSYNLPTINLCKGIAQQIGINSSANTTYLWQPAIGLNNVNIANPIANPSSTIQYQLFVSKGVCTDTLYQMVNVIETDISTSANQVLCDTNQNITLNSFPRGTGGSIIWSTSSFFTDTLNNDLTDSNLTIIPKRTQIYYVQIERNGCKAYDSILIEIFDDTLAFSGNNFICLDDTTNIMANAWRYPSQYSYDWSPDLEIISGDGTNSIRVAPSANTRYYVTATHNTFGCIIRDSIDVSVSNLSTATTSATASPNVIFEGGSSQLNALPGGYSYAWQPNNSLNVANIQNPTARPMESTWYYVLINDNGCVRTDSVYVEVVRVVCGPPNIFVPNAFTPNEDNTNDNLYVRGNFIEELNFSVYNRWGEKVFETKNINEGWDGVYKGKSADPAVFVYHLEATCVGNKQYFEKGNVTLIR